MPAEGRPKLGLALSGAAARSVFYVGFLEVLAEAKIPISIIAAQSGASIVAAAYACGTLQKLKDIMLSLNWRKLRQFLRFAWSEGALYSLDEMIAYVREHITHGKRFEDLDTRLMFTATNLEAGQLVSLSLGDIARAVQATCAVPGLFTPVQWGNKTLVDGGLLSVMPGAQARQAGADVVVGADAKATRYIFLSSHITARKWYKAVRARLSDSIFMRALINIKGLSTKGVEVDIQSAQIDEDTSTFNSVRAVLGRSLDLAGRTRARDLLLDPRYDCDLLISEGPGKFGDTANLAIMKQTYESGRLAAQKHIDQIRALIRM